MKLTDLLHAEIKKEIDSIFERMVYALVQSFSSYEEYLEWHALQVSYIAQVVESYRFLTIRKYNNAIRKLEWSI